LVVKTYLLVPPVIGKVKVQVPAALAGEIVTTPEVIPDNPIVPVEAPATPKTGVTVIDGTPVAPALRIPPLAVASPVTVLAPLE
jgi:hypothetical protein